MFKSIAAGLSGLLRERFGDLTATGRFWMWAGLITLACSMGMAYDYGSQVSLKHGLVMAALSFATAFIVEEAYSHWRKGFFGVAIGLCVIAIPMFWQETKSHIAYTAGFRGINVESATLQQTKYDDGRDDVEKAKQTLALFEKRLVELQNGNAWSTSVTADALRAKLAGMNLAIENEAKRGGCKQKCEERTKERDEIASRIAVLERIDDTTQKIEATKKVINSYKEKVAAVEHKPSIVQHQNTTLFKLAAMMTSGNVEASPFLKEVVEQENTIGLALMPVILPALSFFMMGLYRRGHELEPAPAIREAVIHHEPQPLSVIPPIEHRYAPSPTRSRISTLSVHDLLQSQAKAA